MKIAGFGWFIARFHGKDLSQQLGRIAMSGYLGQRVAGGPWDKMCGDQPLPGATEQNPLAIAEGRQVNWLGAQIAARESLQLNPAETTFTVEFEQSQFRNPAHFRDKQHHWDVAMSMVLASMQFVTGIETAAAGNFNLREIMKANSTPDLPKTWSWQVMNPIRSAVLIGADAVMNAAMEWKLPEFSDTSEFVLGSDVSMPG